MQRLESIVIRLLENRALILMTIFIAGSFVAKAEDNSSTPAHPAVLELFTSQGCSSCPPADQLLRKLSTRPDIIGLSFPVNYWDYLGWKDTLASHQNTQRQRDYASAQGEGQVYTPEIIVNGLKSCVGSDEPAIEDAIKATAPIIQRDAFTLTVRRNTGELVIEAGAASTASKHKSGKVWVASVLPSATVSIGRGENSGRTVTYTNVVEQLTEAGNWEGFAKTYSIPLSSVGKPGDIIVVFVQAGTLGPIVAAKSLG